MNRPDIERIKARGCGSHSCKVAEDKGGQRTNGPCRCVESIRDLLAYIASLEAALPKTADGEVIMPGKKLWGRMDSDDGEWYERGSLKRGFRVPMVRDDIAVFVSDHGWEYECSPREVFATHPDTGERA